MPVVAVQPLPEHRRSRSRRGERQRVGPFAQRRLDETLCLTIRARRVRPGADMAQPHQSADGLERPRTVGCTVVRHYPLNANAAIGEPCHCTLQKAGRSVTSFVVKNFDVRYAGSVVDANMREFPADSPVGSMTYAGDSMPDSPLNSPQFLDVDVNEFSGLRPLITNHRLTRVQPVQPRNTSFFCNSRYRSSAPTDLCCNPIVRPAAPTQTFDSSFEFFRHSRWHSVRTAAAIGHAGFAFRSITLDPLEDRRSSKTQRRSNLMGRLAALEPTYDGQAAPFRQLGVLMAHHASFSQEAEDPHLREGIRNLPREHT